MLFCIIMKLQEYFECCPGCSCKSDFKSERFSHPCFAAALSNFTHMAALFFVLTLDLRVALHVLLILEAASVIC